MAALFCVDRLTVSIDSAGGGAWPCVVLRKGTAKSGACGLIRFNTDGAVWPFSVGRVVCLVSSVSV